MGLQVSAPVQACENRENHVGAYVAVLPLDIVNTYTVMKRHKYPSTYYCIRYL